MTKTYCITDVHGMYDLLVRALAWIEEDTAGQPHKVVFLGDYVDRGPDSRECLELLMDGPNRPLAEWHVLLGNHEIMMLQGLTHKDVLEAWMANGGDATLKNYVEDMETMEMDDEALQQALLFIAEDMEHFYEDAYRVYVHAYVKDGQPLEDQTLDIMLWTRYQPNHEGFYGSRHVVHGHTPHKEVVLKEGRTNLDTGASHYGRLSIGVFDDDVAGGPVTVVHIE